MQWHNLIPKSLLGLQFKWRKLLFFFFFKNVQGNIQHLYTRRQNRKQIQWGKKLGKHPIHAFLDWKQHEEALAWLLCSARNYVTSWQSKRFGGNERGLTSVSLNELVRYKIVAFLEAFSGYFKMAGKETEGGGGRKEEEDNSNREQKSELLWTDLQPFYCTGATLY